MLSVDARREGPVIFARIRPNNPDGGIPLVTRTVGGIGPFDFSDAVAPGAVTIQVKTDNGAWVNDTIDLDDELINISAVTVAQLFAAINTAAVTNITASSESGTGRIKLALTTPGAAKYLQVRGEVAIYAGFGGVDGELGYTTEFRKIDTMASVADADVNHDSERLEWVDGTGDVSAIITKSYKTSKNLTLTDNADDMNIRAMSEGGQFFDDGYTAEGYKEPLPSAEKPVLTLEWFAEVYASDDNNQGNVLGYNWYRANSVKHVSTTDNPGDRSAHQFGYLYSAVPYRNPLDNVKDATAIKQFLTVTEYLALAPTTV
jgi:hypothetical protein